MCENYCPLDDELENEIAYSVAEGHRQEYRQAWMIYAGYWDE